MIDKFENVGATGNDITLTENALNFFTAFVPSKIELAMIATAARTVGVATRVRLGFYRLDYSTKINPNLRPDSVGTNLNPGDVVSIKKIAESPEIGIDSSFTTVRLVLPRPVLVVGGEIIAVALQHNTADCRWFGGVTSTAVEGGFYGGPFTFGPFPDIMSSRQGWNIPEPHIIFLSKLGARRSGR